MNVAYLGGQRQFCLHLVSETAGMPPDATGEYGVTLVGFQDVRAACISHARTYAYTWCSSNR